MKKEELKEALQKIQPSEQLMNATLLKIKEQQSLQSTNEERGKVKFYNNPVVYRWTSVACAAALLLCLGISSIGNKPDTLGDDGNHRQISQTSETHDETEQNKSYDAEVEGIVAVSYDEWIQMQVEIFSCSILSVTQEDKDAGISTHAIVEFHVQNIVAHSGQGEVEGLENIKVYVGFDNEADLNRLIDCMGSEICVTLIPYEYTEDVNYRVVDFK